MSISKLPLAGSQGWTHRYHGSNNDAVSQDTAIKPPLMTQWLGLPLRDAWWGTAIAGDGGRLFTIWCARAKQDLDKHTLTVRSVSNWHDTLGASAQERKDKRPYNPAHCCMVATPDRLYLIDGDGVLILNPETAAEAGRLMGPQRGGQIKWIALADGVLAMLAGDTDVLQTGADETYQTNPYGRHLMAYDVASGKPLWSQDEAKPIDERFIAVEGGRCTPTLPDRVFPAGVLRRAFCAGKSPMPRSWRV